MEAVPSRNFSRRRWQRVRGHLMARRFHTDASFRAGRGDFVDGALLGGRVVPLPHSGGCLPVDVAYALSGSSAHGAGQECVGEPELLGVGTA